MSTDKYNAPDIIIKNRISDDDKYLKQNLNQYWEELLESDYPEIKQFAQDLIRYQLATTAGNFTKNGIFNLLPISAIQSTGYADYMRSITERFNVTDLDFDNFFLNNWTNNKIVKPVQLYKKVFSSETDKVEDQLQFPVLFSENKNHSGSRYPVMMIPNYRPDLNMDNPLVRTEVKKILKFWLDLGVDGFREDVITFISKKEGLPDDHLFPIFKGIRFYNHGPHIHEYLQEFRRSKNEMTASMPIRQKNMRRSQRFLSVRISRYCLSLLSSSRMYC